MFSSLFSHHILRWRMLYDLSAAFMVARGGYRRHYALRFTAAAQRAAGGVYGPQMKEACLRDGLLGVWKELRCLFAALLPFLLPALLGILSAAACYASLPRCDRDAGGVPASSRTCWRVLFMAGDMWATW